MKTLLVYPPFADPTQAYVSLPVLKSHLKGKGYDAKIADLNIQAILHLLADDSIDLLVRDVRRSFSMLDEKRSLSMPEQIRYKALYDSIRTMESLRSRMRGIPDALRNKNVFYDFGAYSATTEAVAAVFDALNALHFPFRFGTNIAGHFTLPWSFRMLESYVAGMKSPLIDFYNGVSSSGLFDGVDLAGISLTFVSQIPEAFTLARRIKTANRNCRVIIGGTAMSQIALTSERTTLARFFEYTDFICCGDGEETLVGILAVLDKGGTEGSAHLESVPNLVSIDRDTRAITFGPHKAFDIASSALPDYSDYDLDSYLAPERILLYSPTRRCYWRKCSFCTYGMSFAQGYGYREIGPGKAASDLETLSKLYNVRNFYLSCDVLSPTYAIAFAREIKERGIDIRWSSDLRIEPDYTEGACKTMYESGLRSVAFGVESGSDKMLGLMNKGITRALIRSVNANFHKAGIATQWMTFTYHPGETRADAMETLELIHAELNSIALFIVGEFQLVPGSKISGSPQSYGIKRVYYTKGDELGLYPLFSLANNKRSSLSERDDIDSSIDDIASGYALDKYPWAGAISTHHTFLYFISFGQNAFKARGRITNNASSLKSTQARKTAPDTHYALRAIDKNIGRFLEGIQDALIPIRIQRGDAFAFEAELSEEYIESLCAQFKPLFRPNHVPQVSGERIVERITGDECK